MGALPLACPVNGCLQPLDRVGGAYRCGRGHAFDVARSGYVNLLQPQDRRSRTPGDARAVVRDRAALFAAGVGRELADAIVERVRRLALPSGAIVLDLGSGAGDLLGRLHRDLALTGIGLDLSSAAADHAARRFPDLTWVVANADRAWPIASGGVHVVMSINGRRHVGEAVRVLAPGGALMVAVPAEDDLAELRKEVQGEAVLRDRLTAVIHEHVPPFALVERWQVRQSLELDREALLALLRTTYRGARSSAHDRVSGLDRLEVTVASDLALFAR